METPKSFKARLARILRAADVKRDSELARALDITPQSVSSAKMKERIPAGWVEKISETFGVSADWLLHARGPMRVEDFEGETSRRIGEPSCELPLLSVSADGPTGWCRSSVLAVSTSMPSLPQDAVSVLAVGRGLVPAGILPGQVLYCDPATRPVYGEAVYVERNGLTGEEASLKIFRDVQSSNVLLEAWREKQPGAFESYTVHQPVSEVLLMAPVILVRRRL